MARRNRPFEVVMEGFDDLKTCVLPGEVDLVLRMLKDQYEKALQSPEQDPQLMALFEQLGFPPITHKKS
ncbi:MAG: hypothetical protein WCG31_08620 [Deltaproteobacteria bacterium]